MRYCLSLPDVDSTKWLLGLNNRPAHAPPAGSDAAEGDLERAAATAERASPRVAALAPETRIGRYQLIRELGSGGMGVVYEAHDPNLDRRVAIKLMLSALDEARLAREARALAKLAHPNVVSVHDVGTADGHLFIAMELVDGTTLRHWLTDRPRSFRESLEVLMQAGRGLAAAHAAGLVHRDFKPDNVIVGVDGRVRVLDFGIVGAVGDLEARARGGAAAVASGRVDLETTMTVGPITVAGAIVGTPAYMAPEQHRAEATDESADQFAFCVVLWELVYGSRPFNSSHFATLSRGGVVGPPSEPPAGRSAPAWLRRILDRGLAIDRTARHPSMNALLEALAAGLARHAATAHLLGRRYEKLRPTPGNDVGDAERAIDRVTGRLVTIQSIALPDGTEADADARVALARAFRELASLRHPNLVGLLDFGFAQDGAPYLVLDQQDAGAELALAVRQEPRRMLDYLVQILRGLGYLHRHRIALGAIEQRAVRVFDQQLKLVPLGRVAEAGPRAHRAPEIANGSPPSVAGDLYAFGLLATELLSVQSALESEPSARELASKIEPVLTRLRDENPAARYENAEEVVAALADVTGRGLASYTLETRESRLRAAPLIGRDRELEQLESAVRAACAGRGSGWLVSGESGAGKSRLLDEVGTLGLIDGALVLRGQEEREGGNPYRLFRDALNWLAVVTDLDELEASVLLPLVPNLGKLLGRAVEPAPDLDAPSMHARVIEVVQRILRRQEQPIVLLLEDLQWARSDSLQLLDGVLSLAGSLPLLVVTTSRDDEQTRLGEKFGMQVIHLGRLPGEVIADLAQAMIGETGKHPAVLQLLQRETEGNAFFLVEVVRALAEAAGGVERIGPATLPEKVFAGGIQSLVQQRLRAVPREAQALLQVAAVIGRRIDPKLLTELMPEVELEGWTAKCLDAAVLERQGGELRFRHDKLREGMLATMSDDETSQLHARVADTIERVYPNDSQRYTALAHHFGQANNVAKEIHYARLAGELAILHGAVREGIALLEGARSNLAAHDDHLDLGRVCASLGDAYYFLPDMSMAMKYAADAIRAVGVRVPGSALERVLALIWQLLVHIARRLNPRLGSHPDAARRAAAFVASTAAGRAATACISLADGPGVLLFSLMALNLSERAGQKDLAAAGVVGYSLACVGLPGLARSYFEPSGREAHTEVGAYPVLKASYLLGTADLAGAEAVTREELEIVRRKGFRPSETFSWFLLGYGAYYRGDLRKAEAHFRLAIAHQGTQANFVPAMALVSCLRGNVEGARTFAEQGLALSNPAAPRSTAYGVLALTHLRAGNPTAALEAATTAVQVVAKDRSFGYAGAGFFMGVFEAYLAELERCQRSAESTRRVRRQLRGVFSHCRAWARSFRVGRPLLLLYEGKLAWLDKDSSKAQRDFRASQELAQAMGLELQVAFAHLELARIAGADSNERSEHLRLAKPGFVAAGARPFVEQIAALSRTPRA